VRKRLLSLLIAAALASTACTDRIEPLPKESQTGGDAAETLAPAKGDNWTGYLYGPTHTSHNAKATAITKKNASALRPVWEWIPDAATEVGQPAAQLFASPTVYGGRIFIGSNSGEFYALDEATGTLEWKRSLGYLEDNESCGRRGTTSTASVAEDPETGEPTVYVGAADGNLYALSAEDGTERWRSRVVSPEEDGHNWSSPTVVRGRIYIGMASHCKSTVRGGVREYDQSTGRLLNTYWTVPESVNGGSVWTSVAANPDDKAVYVSTGNGDLQGGDPGDSFSLVRLNGDTLKKNDIWTAPLVGTDLDFGSSPTLFWAMLGGDKTPMVGACNKNGHYYALEQSRLSAGPVWEAEVSGSWPDEGNCLGAAIWDSEEGRLFLAAAQTRVDGRKYRGSIRELDPETGDFLWELGLPGTVWGSSSMNANDVLAVPSFDTDPEAKRAVWLIDADSGEILTELDTGDSPVFAQPVFAGEYLFLATVAQGLIAYKGG
jgi:polyvinyl alcohol dehydrogenase (cytochrome)